MTMKAAVFALLIPVFSLADVVPLRVAAAKGTLMCGETPYEGAHVYLLRMNSEDKGQVLDGRITSDSGMFHLEGNTYGRSENETTLVPIVRIFHRCDVENKTPTSYRRWQFQVPADYVNNGRRALKTYDAGTMNLQLHYPKEKKVKFEPY